MRLFYTKKVTDDSEMLPSNPCAFSWTNFPLRQNLHVFRGWNFLFLTFCFTACYLKNVKKHSVSTQFISFTQILRLFLKFCGFCVLVCNSVLYDTKTFLFLTFCFNDMLLKKRNDNSVSTQFISFAQILRLFLQFCGFCVLVCNSVSFAMFNFCSSHSVSRLVT